MIAKGFRSVKKKGDCKWRCKKLCGLAAGLYQSGAIVFSYAPSQHQTISVVIMAIGMPGGPDFAHPCK